MLSVAALRLASGAEQAPLVVSSSSDIHGSVLSDTIVQKNCSLHVSGNLLGSLTIEAGAHVVVEGSVDGKIINRGGKLVVNNKGLAACVASDGPPEVEACGILKFNLSALASNWETVTRHTLAECAGVVKANAFGCGIGAIAGALAKTGCRTFFVSDLPEARRVRAVAPAAVIYVLNGFCAGTGPAFADINARPVINSALELAEWDAFVSSEAWMGGCALNVDTGDSRLGLSMEEAVALAPRARTLRHGFALLMSRLDRPEKPDHLASERQIGVFRDLRRLYEGVAASFAESAEIFSNPKIHFDLVRVDSALFGINPVPDKSNPMQPVLELCGRILQIRFLQPGQTTPENPGWTATRRTRLALVSVGYFDGYPRPADVPGRQLQVLVRGHLCPVAGCPAMDLLAVDLTDLPDPSAARCGEMVMLIGDKIGIDDLAAAANKSGCELLSGLGQRFHRIYYAI